MARTPKISVGEDFIVNGHGVGDVASAMEEVAFDPGQRRPYLDDYGRVCVSVNSGKWTLEKDRFGNPYRRPVLVQRILNHNHKSSPFDFVQNATVLRKDEWIELDRRVIMATRQRLRAWDDLQRSSVYGGFNAMARTMLEHETMSDPGLVHVDMDAQSQASSDEPKFQLEGVPLPITHGGFWFSSRKLAISRNTGSPLDMTMPEAVGRRIAETVEQTTIGTLSGLAYGNAADYGRAPRVYGYTNFPARITKTDLTTPTGISTADDTIQDVLEMRELLYQAGFFGPFILYHSTDWDNFLDDDYSAAKGDNTLRDRILKIEGISDVRRLDFLNATTNPFTMIMVQMTSDVADAINGMDITTVQWESHGGFRLNFKILCIKVPRLKADFNGNCGILHATTS